jgi:hypothetical protein
MKLVLKVYSTRRKLRKNLAKGKTERDNSISQCHPLAWIGHLGLVIEVEEKVGGRCCVDRRPKRGISRQFI